MNLPKARTADLLEQAAGSELLVYDLRIDKAYNLNETSKTVFKACDGETSFEQLKRRHKYTDDLIYFTLDELKRNGLMNGDYPSRFAGMNRREVIRKVGLATMVALPVISGLSAPQASQAASRCVGGTCFDNSECPLPCTSCSATGICSVGGAACTGSGTRCSVTGTCNVPPRQTFGTCSVGGRCTGSGSACTNFGSCNVTPGTCS